jgi:biopolymer transport protein ExbB/TolQ
MWWVFFILFLLISVVSSTLLFYALRRINEYENIITQFQQIVEYSNERVKSVDNTGHFESDDEIGFFFEEVKSLQSLLNNLFETQETQDDKDKS